MDEREDEYLDFAPAKHAAREAFAFCTVAGFVLGLAGYGLWTLVWSIIGAWG
jgi:hypothetical protein